MIIQLLTGNKDKIKAAQQVFSGVDVQIESLKSEAPEIQANTSVEIARFAAVEAFKLTGKPVIREDHSFYIKDLGFPGPFMSYMDKVISNEQLLKILSTLESRDAYFELGAAFVDSDGRMHEFSYQVPVVMSEEARGNKNLRWERIMMFPGDTKTFAELESDDRSDVWTKNYESIVEVIQSKS